MKHLPLILLSLLLASCANVSTCKQSPEGALPKCQTTPPAHEWTSYDGLKLPYLEALPKSGKAKAVVILVSGTDGVTGDYASITTELTKSGYAVYGSENRSFVYGPKTNRANPRDWHPWLKDLQRFTRLVRSKQPGLKVFWHGHSFGGVEVLETAAQSRGVFAPDGLIVHSPGFALMHEKKEFWHGVGYGSIAWLRVPHIRLMEKGNMPMTDNPEFDCRWKHSEDRVREGIKVRFFIQAANMGIRARNSSPKLTLPVLAMWGGQDRLGLGGNDGERPAYDHYMRHELAGGKATQFYREEGQHLLTEGKTKQEALAAIVGWLNQQR